MIFYFLLSLKAVKPCSRKVQVKFQVLISVLVSNPMATDHELVAAAVRKFKLGQVITPVFITWTFMQRYMKAGYATQAASYTETSCC